MKKIIYSTLILALLCSCEDKGDKLNFSQFEIKDKAGETGIKVHNNGEIYIGENLVGTVKKNGQLKDNANKILAHINNDYMLVDGNNNLMIKVSQNGDMDNGSGKLLRWSEEGEFLKGDNKTGLHIALNNTNSYLTASIVLFLFMNFGK